MRLHRSTGAIIAAGALMMGGVSATPAVAAPHITAAPHAVTTPRVPAASDCPNANSSVCIIQNLDFEMICCSTHNVSLTTSSKVGGAYKFVLRPAGVWGEFKNNVNGLCWNTYWNAGNAEYEIASDSCNTSFTNTNELFRKIVCNGNTLFWCLQSYFIGLSYYVWGSNGDNIPLQFSSAVNTETEWNFLTP